LDNNAVLSIIKRIRGYRRQRRSFGFASGSFGRASTRRASTQWPLVERRGSSSDFEPDGLRLLSYNIQSGIGTSGMHRYVTEGWKHILPHSDQLQLLHSIANVTRDFDLVGIQEADVGSLRTGYINQAEYVARCAGFDHWHAQTNRRVSQFATSAVAAMSRLPLRSIKETRLPGRIPGRGALIVTLAGREVDLTVAIVHLALGRRDRLQQIESLARNLPDNGPIVLMGDFNCIAQGPEFDLLQSRCGLRSSGTDAKRTFPSWRPVRGIDHILVTDDLKVAHSEVLNHTYSDHRPVAVTVDWEWADAPTGEFSLIEAA